MPVDERHAQFGPFAGSQPGPGRADAKAGGGEVTIHGRDGKIRDSDTVKPGNDPNPPRDKR